MGDEKSDALCRNPESGGPTLVFVGLSFHVDDGPRIINNIPPSSPPHTVHTLKKIRLIESNCQKNVVFLKNLSVKELCGRCLSV